MTGKTLNTDTAVAADAERDTDMTEKITREEIEALLKLADAATPGPWVKHDTMPNGSAKIWASFPCINGLSAYFTIARIDTPGDDEVGYTEGAINSHQTIANAEFIAAANPAVLKALCTLALQAEAMREALIETAASLSAAHSLLSRGGKRAAPSNKMFAVMLEDYRKSLDRAVATLSSLPEPRR